jgi:hypothetical protein
LLLNELGEGDPGFQHPTEEEIAEDIAKASAVREGSDNELDEPQESITETKILSSATNGIGEVINYVCLQQIENCRRIMNT